MIPLHPFLLLMVASFILNEYIFTATYVTRTKHTVNKLFLRFVFTNGMYIVSDILVYFGKFTPEAYDYVVRLSALAWALIPSLFTDFIYGFIGRKRDWFLYFSFLFNGFYIFLYLIPGLYTYSNPDTSWGKGSVANAWVTVYGAVNLLLLIILLMIILLGKANRNRFFKKIIIITVLLSIFSGSVTYITNILSQFLFPETEVYPLSAVTYSLFIFFIYKYIKNHNIFFGNVEKVEQFTNILFEGEQDAVFIVNAYGNIVKANHTGQELFDLEHETYEYNASIYDIILEYDFSKNYRNKEIAYRKNKKTYYFLLSSSAVSSESAEKHELVILRNISDLKEVESDRSRLMERIAFLDKMESLGLLAGTVAHELNNVLTPIIGYSDLLISEHKGDKAFAPLKDIRKAGAAAGSIVDDLLTLTRRHTKDFNSFNVLLPVKEVLNSYKIKSALNRKSITVKSDFTEEDLFIYGSSLHIQKMIINLINNAIDAVENNGAIDITVKKRVFRKELPVYRTEVQPGQYVQVGVYDTGTGISETDIERVFEPFFSKKSGSSAGTGLGMTVIWSTVQDHNGFIDIQSSKQSGTKIDIFLPLVDPPPEIRTQSDHSAGMPADFGIGKTIVIIDDQAEQVDFLKRMYKSFGFSVKGFLTGEKALEYLKKNKADLVTLDMQLNEKMDGLDVYNEMLSNDISCPVIIISAYAENERIKETLRLGAKSFIKKPYSLETILTETKKIL
jgi:signal transduction histidine kinase/CheY-like chemotaxis protein